MKALVAGVERMTGHSEKTKRDYDMCRIYVLELSQSATYEKRQVTAYGYRVVEVDATPEAVSAMAGLKFPGMYDLEVDMAARGGKLVPVIVGVGAVKHAA